MLLIVLVVTTFVLWLVISWVRMKPHNFPPGPAHLPVVGSILAMAGPKPHLKMADLRAAYGPLVGLVLPGGQLAVAVCGADAVLQALRHEHLQGRPDDADLRERTFNQRLGVFFTDGPFWSTQRRFTLRHLRDFGFGKLSMESRILEEVEDLIQSVKDKTVQVTDLFAVHMVSVLWAVAAGTRFERHDARHQRLIDGVNQMFRAGNPTGTTLARIFPVLKKIAPRLIGYEQEVKARTQLQDFIKETIREHKTYLDENNPRDFIDVYLREMKNSEDETFTEDGLAAIIFDLFFAGAESTSNSLSFALLYMVLYPEVQEKLHKELDTVVGRARRVSLEDRPRLPYLEAVIAEISRVNSIAPVCPPHTATEDTTLNGYTIPKGSALFISLWSVLNDREHWGDPEQFRPERFIDGQTGAFVRDPYLINFGTGARSCLGVALARNNLFLFLAALLQDFALSLPGDEPRPSTEALPGLTLAPQPFRVRFASR